MIGITVFRYIMTLPILKDGILKKSHTCEEDGNNLRISVWHLLMNLKNNYLLVYQKNWCYDLQFLRYRVWQTGNGHYGSLFPLLPPPCFLKTWKIRILKKWKKLQEITSFYECVPKIGTVPEIQSETERIFCYFGPFFGFLPHLTARKIKIKKNWKRWLEISSFCTCVPKMMIRWCAVPEIWYRMDGQTERRMEKMA